MPLSGIHDSNVVTSWIPDQKRFGNDKNKLLQEPHVLPDCQILYRQGTALDGQFAVNNGIAATVA